jgi:hypothetical protein
MREFINDLIETRQKYKVAECEHRRNCFCQLQSKYDQQTLSKPEAVYMVIVTFGWVIICFLRGILRGVKFLVNIILFNRVVSH